jgi:peptide/nickel transport system ATP-binding protein
MIFITHDLRVASQICDEIAVMHRGQIVERGPPSQIFLDPKASYTRELVAAIPGEQPGNMPQHEGYSGHHIEGETL